MSKKIFVYENWTSREPNLIGTLYVDTQKGKEVFSFEYDDAWLKLGDKYIIDPNLNYYTGRQFATNAGQLFGMFSDSAPDRWGRVLMNRREAIIAQREERQPRKLLESDYLLGVDDGARMGALRFKIDKDGEFLSNDKDMAVPAWTHLRELEDAAKHFEDDELSLDDRWIKQLLGPGSSLGGARPKASVKDVDGSLWIAKFPSKNDEYNMGAWEKVVHDLARLCGLNVPESRLERFSNRGDTFLVKRFDRNGEDRIHFSSAMTMLNKTDGASAEDGTSYLDIVGFIRTAGCNVNDDLVELWKRIVFSMAVCNTDDHLRNHGFVLNKAGWRLSPMYDVNPNPYSNGYLSLNVDDNDNRISLDLAANCAKYFGIKNNANEMIKEIVCTVNDNWERIAKQYGIQKSSVEMMRSAFALKYTR